MIPKSENQRGLFVQDQDFLEKEVWKILRMQKASIESLDRRIGKLEEKNK